MNRKHIPAGATHNRSGIFLVRWNALWTVVTHPGVESTNNAAERVLRPAVIWRKQCRRPERGRQSLRGADSLRRDDVPPTGRQRVEPADRCSAGGHDGSAGANPAAHPLNDYDDPIADSFSLLQPKDERQVFWCVPYLLDIIKI